MSEIIVIGGGAAGMMAAITAASERTGLTAPGTLDRLLPVLEAYGLTPAAIADAARKAVACKK